MDDKRRFLLHLKDFPYIWFFFLLLFVAALLAFFELWGAAKAVGIVSVAVLIVLLLSRPMNAVYGLMGTTGSIRMFFSVFILITLLFAGIYQLGFFQDAGVSYDINQPHVYYGLYAGREREPVTLRSAVQRDTVVYERIAQGETLRESVVQETSPALHYQPVGFWFTWRNTILTALMQEPTDFFSEASTYNASGGSSLDRQKAAVFQWVLVVQILISWIFFGVFISLLYNKFRFES